VVLSYLRLQVEFEGRCWVGVVFPLATFCGRNGHRVLVPVKTSICDKKALPPYVIRAGLAMRKLSLDPLLTVVCDDGGRK